VLESRTSWGENVRAMSQTDDRYEAWEEEDQGPTVEDESLAKAWESLDTGDAETALLHLHGVDADWPERWVPEAIARTMVGELREARIALQRARQIEELREDPDLLWAEGLFGLATWNLAEARTALERLTAQEESPAVLDKLALLDDLEGRYTESDARLARARELDAQFPLPTRIDPEEFLLVVRDAIEKLPEQFQIPLETTDVLVEPVPADWMIDHTDPADTPPDILGLFVGTSEIEGTEAIDAALPRRIFLFQRNLERDAKDRDQLVEEIRKTLFHEIGHMLGFDEEGVAQMGLE